MPRRLLVVLPPLPPRSALRALAGAPLVAALLVGAAGCDSGGTATGEVARWTLDASPLISVGDRPDADSMLLSQVTDARYLANGGIAIADAAANRLLFFDAAGREVARAGRRGRGPGEFVGQLSLVEVAGDSVAVWDPSAGRWTIVDARTGGMRMATESRPGTTMLHAGLLVQRDLPAPPAWVPPLLNALSASSAEIRLGQIDGEGLLWVSQDVALREWQVYADSGAPIAALSLPSDLRVLHFGRGALIGLESDSTGLERVVVHRIARGAAPPVALAPAPATAIADSARQALMASMRNAVVAQEVNYMERSGYTLHADSLRFTPVPGSRFKVLTADARGWTGVAWYLGSGYTCAIFIGKPVPPGWSEGAPRCGW